MFSAMMKLNNMINNRTDTWKTDVNLLTWHIHNSYTQVLHHARYTDGCSFPQCGLFDIFFWLKRYHWLICVFLRNFSTYFFDNRDSSRNDVCTLCGDGHSSVNKHTILNVNYLDKTTKHIFDYILCYLSTIVQKSFYDLSCCRFYRSVSLQVTDLVFIFCCLYRLPWRRTCSRHVLKIY